MARAKVDRGDQVSVRGLKEFRRSIVQVDRNLDKALTKANRETARIVMGKSRGAASTPLQQKAAATLRAVASATGAGIELSKDRFGGVFGAEFGGGKHGKGNPTAAGGYTTQFEPHRGRLGYFVFPTVRRLAEGRITADLYGAAVSDALRDAFPD